MTVPVEITRKLGQSVINQGDTCLKRVEYDWFLEDAPVVGNVNLLIGTGYHAGLAEGYLMRHKGAMLEVDLCVEAAIEAFRKGVEYDEYKQKAVDQFSWTYQPSTYRAPQIVLMPDEAEKIVEVLVRHYWNLDPWAGQGMFVVAAEMSFDLDYPDLPGWRRGGTPDLVLGKMVENGFAREHTIVDHKTSRKNWNKQKGTPTNPQAAWYIDAWRTYSGVEDVRFVYDVMAINLDPETKLPEPSFERRPAPRNEKQIQATLEKGRLLAKLIDQGGPFPPSPDSFLCSPHYCDYWKICPFGSTLNFVDEEAA